MRAREAWATVSRHMVIGFLVFFLSYHRNEGLGNLGNCIREHGNRVPVFFFLSYPRKEGSGHIGNCIKALGNRVPGFISLIC